MSKRNKYIFKGLHVVAWVIFIGLCVEAGAMLVNLIVSIYNPQFIQHLYQKLDLSAIYHQSKWNFFCIYSFVIVLSVLKAYLFYIVIRLLQRMDLSKPFNNFTSEQITKLSYFTFFIGILGYLARHLTQSLWHHGYSIDQLNQYWTDSQAFILTSAIIYIIGTIFAKGVELQNENDLTV